MHDVSKLVNWSAPVAPLGPDQRRAALEAWVVALRSGQYQQGRRALKAICGADKEIRHCCLGVLCEVLGVPNRQEGPYFGFSSGGYTGVLPPEVSNAMGFVDCDPSITDVEGELRGTLAGLNDSDRWSFGQIADLIESAWINGPVQTPVAGDEDTQAT